MICPEKTGNAGEGLQISHTVIVRDWSIRVNANEKVSEAGICKSASDRLLYNEWVVSCRYEDGNVKNNGDLTVIDVPRINHRDLRFAPTRGEDTGANGLSSQRAKDN
jgi:hypothetical protein